MEAGVGLPVPSGTDGGGGGYGGSGCYTGGNGCPSCGIYGNLKLALWAGSGGGGSAGFFGGGGGGALEFVASTLMEVAGTVSANGGPGSGGGLSNNGGAGSGGGLIFAAPTIQLDNTSLIEANAGGNGKCPGCDSSHSGGGGNGGGGRILFLTAPQGPTGPGFNDASMPYTQNVLVNGSGAGNGSIDFGPFSFLGCLHECLNTFDPQHSTTPAVSFNYILQGDVRNQIDTTATASDPLTNAFAYVNQNDFNGNGSSTVGTALDSNGDTIVTFTGSNPILDSDSFNYGSGPAAPHFGLEGISGAPLNVLGQYWTYGDNSTTSLPNLGLVCPQATGTNVQYAVFFADVAPVGTGNTAGTGVWAECAFAGATPTIVATNTTDPPEVISNFAYFTSGTAIPLDSLNFGGTPPPGYPGSEFIALPQYDMLLDPGQGFTFGATTPVPEPSAMTVLCAGFGGLAACRRRRRSTFLGRTKRTYIPAPNRAKCGRHTAPAL